MGTKFAKWRRREVRSVDHRVSQHALRRNLQPSLVRPEHIEQPTRGEIGHLLAACDTRAHARVKSVWDAREHGVGMRRSRDTRLASRTWAVAVVDLQNELVAVGAL